MGVLSGLVQGAAESVQKALNVDELCEGRTENQQKVIRYFLEDSSKLTDAEYDSIVQSKLQSLNLKQRAMEKLGIDETQVNEIDPVHLEGYYYAADDLDAKKQAIYKKTGEDFFTRTSAYQQTWLFFSNEQIFAYQYTFNLDEEGYKETTEEYFYKDIVDFSLTDEAVEYKTTEPATGCGCFNKPKIKFETFKETRFTIRLTGSYFGCSYYSSEYADDAVKGMRAKLREKKL